MELDWRVCLRLLVPLARLPGRKAIVNLNFWAHHLGTLSVLASLSFLLEIIPSISVLLSWLLHTSFPQNSSLLPRRRAWWEVYFQKTWENETCHPAGLPSPSPTVSSGSRLFVSLWVLLYSLLPPCQPSILCSVCAVQGDLFLPLNLE